MARVVLIGWPAVLLALTLASAPTLDYFLNSPDLGYQVSLGHLMLSGKFPFVNMFQHYGPLVTITSAAGQWIHDSVAPEVVICSLGYCLAMTCIFYVVVRIAAARPAWAMVGGVMASFAAWCVLARFYKWYFWCFPMLTLACLSHDGEDGRRWRIRRFAAGLIVGVAFLFRHDLGTACLLAAIAAIAAQVCLMPTRRRMVLELLWLAGGFLLPIACWLGVLAAVGGKDSCGWYFSALWNSTSGTAQHWSLPLPHWDWRHPASNESCRFHLLAVMGLSYGIAVLFGAKALLLDCRNRSSDAILLLAAGLLGLALSPQALFRPDAQHILQVLPPALVVAACLVLRLLDGQRSNVSLHGNRALRVTTALAYLALLVFPVIGIWPDIRTDLAPLGKDLPQRYRALAAGLDAANPANAMAQLAHTVQRHSSPGQPILVIPLLPQTYYWADRPMSGLLNGYAGIFSQNLWRQRNLEAVQQEPPALVVADRDFLSGNPNALFQKCNPELYAWIKERYPRVVAEIGDCVVCAK